MRIIRTNGFGRQTKLSRQRRWQLERVTAGLCSQCAAGREHYAQLCDACAEKRRIARRARYGFKPQRQGRRGRPPLTRSDG